MWAVVIRAITSQGTKETWVLQRPLSIKPGSEYPIRPGIKVAGSDTEEEMVVDKDIVTSHNGIDRSVFTESFRESPPLQRA